jgi:hypothetical protein
VLDIAATVDQNTDLAPDVGREFREGASEVVRNEAVRLEAPSTEPLEGFRLTGLEAARVAVDLNRDGVRSDALVARSVARVGEAAASGQTGRANPELGCPEGRCRSLGIEPWGSALRRPRSSIRHTLRDADALPGGCDLGMAASWVVRLPIISGRILASFRLPGVTYGSRELAFFYFGIGRD